MGFEHKLDHKLVKQGWGWDGEDLDETPNFFFMCVQRDVGLAGPHNNGAGYLPTSQMRRARNLHEQVHFCAVKE